MHEKPEGMSGPDDVDNEFSDPHKRTRGAALCFVWRKDHNGVCNCPAADDLTDDVKQDSPHATVLAEWTSVTLTLPDGWK